MADFASEHRPASNRNKWPASNWNTWPTSSESAPIEVEKLTAALTAGPWVDVMRRHTPHSEKLYTWWSYRSPDWEKADKGRRLDHVWVGAPLAPHFRDMSVVKSARGWDRPSDHAPVVVDLDL